MKKKYTPWLIAHRGDSKLYPENTNASIQSALNYKIQGIETDIQVTKDQVPVLYHDHTLAKVGYGRKKIAQLNYDEIQKIDFGRWFNTNFIGEKIISLKDFLISYQEQTHLFLEIKYRDKIFNQGRYHSMIQSIFPLLKELGSVDRLSILSFNLQFLQLAMKMYPQFKYVLNCNRALRLTSLVRSQIQNFDAICVQSSAVIPSYVESLHDLGKKVFTFTCNRVKDFEKVFQSKVDGIMTDKPRWAQETLQELLLRD